MPTALVTGPTAGIGAAFASALAARGYDLVLVSRDAARLREVAARLGECHGVRADFLAADLSDAAGQRLVEQRLAQPDAPIDVLINNAGSGLPLPFPESPIADEERLLDLLVRSVLRLTYAALPGMLARRSGVIVNVSSVAAFVPRGTYGAAKAWVTSFSEWLGYRYRDTGCAVMALCPGFVRTEFHQRMGMSVGHIPSWMWLDADDVVARALDDLAAGKVISIPGRRYRALTALARIGPRRAVAAVSARGS